MGNGVPIAAAAAAAAFSLSRCAACLASISAACATFSVASFSPAEDLTVTPTGCFIVDVAGAFLRLLLPLPLPLPRAGAPRDDRISL